MLLRLQELSSRHTGDLPVSGHKGEPALFPTHRIPAISPSKLSFLVMRERIIYETV